jgi:N-acetylglutamate synthase-like GNAT family acetyltransferase
MIIRKYQAQDQSAVIDLILNIQRNEFDIEINVEDQPDLKDIEQFYQQGNGNFWVAVNDDSVIGTVAMLDIGTNALALRKMFVSAEYRGKQHNIAQSLLDLAISWAIEQGVHHIYLGTTSQFLAAHRFYEKNLFEEIEIQALPLGFPRMQVDSKFYQLKLPAGT